MNNRYGLPEVDVEATRKRDTKCVYCHKEMHKPGSGMKRQDWATIEHLNHLPPWDNPETIAICCFSCNASRGNKKITDWFKMEYCLSKNINIDTVAQPVRDYLEKYND